MSSCVLGFNGERLGSIGETYHLGNGYRAYYPGLMRFSCPDSWSPFARGGLNPYAYCHADPINHSDPSGHFSWQAGLGIGLGIVGLLTAAFTAGASIAAAGSISAALGASSAITLATGAAGLLADISGLVSTATQQSDPKASSWLGWVSFAAGLLSFGLGLAAGGYRLLNKTRVESGYESLATEQVPSAERRTQPALSDLEGISKNPIIMPEIMRHLSGLEVDKLRATSTTMHANLAPYLKKLEKFMVPMEQGQEVSLTEALREPNIMASDIKTLRKIWHGDYPFTPPSQLSRNQFNPANFRYMLQDQARYHMYHHEFQEVEAIDNAFLQEIKNRNRIFKGWQTLFHALHPDDFANI